MTSNEMKYVCTVPSIWVCLIDGRFLVGAKGNTAWKRKSDTAVAFKHSDYWSWIVDGLKDKHPDMVEELSYGRWWRTNEGKTLEEKAYRELLENGTVKYMEISPVPDWVNLK